MLAPTFYVLDTPLTDGNLFAVNFHSALYEGTDWNLYQDFDIDDHSESNEASIVKQGLAIADAIYRIRQATGADRVQLAGHSMGGLAIREYLQRTDGAGTPRWWIDKEPGGHHIAQVVTFGTPHRGSNFGSLFKNAQIPSLYSEATRDLRYSYPGGSAGRYLFGGPEDFCGGTFGCFHNTDVDADGDQDDYIVGLNDYGSEAGEGTRSNPAMPLPTDLRYTYVIASGCTTSASTASGFLRCLVGSSDGVVSASRQYLWQSDSDGDFMHPRGFSDFLVTSTAHDEQTSDWLRWISGLDEPDQPTPTWRLPLDRLTQAALTPQPYYDDPNDVDADVWAVETTSPSRLTVSIGTSVNMLALLLRADGTEAADLLIPSGSVSFTFDLPAGTSYLALMAGVDPSATSVPIYNFYATVSTTTDAAPTLEPSKPTLTVLGAPTSTQRRLLLTGTTGTHRIQIYDVQGRLLHEQASSDVLDTSRLPSGLYFAVVTQDAATPLRASFVVAR